MSTLLTIVVSLVVFGTTVLVHELGHFWAARRCGIHVEEFSIGFGPVIWTKVKNGTRYSVRLLPIGGYNMMSGYSQEEGEAQAAYDPKAPLLPATVSGKTYPEATPGQRFFVMISGALMNFLAGFLVLIVLLSSRAAITSKTVYDFLGENPRSEATGLQAGDEVMSVNGKYCFVAEDIMYELQRTGDYTASFTVMRNGNLVTLPDVQFDTATNEAGETTMVLDFRVYGIAKSPLTVVQGAGRYFAYYARSILRSFIDLATGNVGINELSGPVGVVSAVGQAVSYGWRDVLTLAALITINLGIFNLLPIPGLDGFKLLFLAWEGITARPVPEKIQAGINAAGMVMLLMLMLFVTWQDVARIFMP